jgi:hypothetical protein
MISSSLNYLLEMAAKILPTGYLLAVVGSPKGKLPQWLCTAEFESPVSLHDAGPDFNSRLYIR